MSEFQQATALRAGATPDVFEADLHPGWAIGGKPNGGYLLAMLCRAACQVTGTGDPLAVSAHYLRAPDSGAADVRTEVVRRGRRVSTTRAVLSQGGRPCLDALLATGELADAAVDWSSAAPPDMPGPEECVADLPSDFTVEIYDHIDLRLDPATAPFPTPSGEPLVRFWFRLRDGSEPDVLTLVLAADAGPPTVFNLERYGWAPTVELTVLLRGRPAPGWLCCEARSNLLAGGWFDEEANVWDSTGRLVAQSRQLALTGTG